MNSKLMKMVMAAGVAMTVGANFAQETQEDPIAAAAANAAAAMVANISKAAAAMPVATVEQIQAADAAQNPPPTAAEMKNDAGVQTVIKMQDEGKVVEANARKETAEEQVKNTLKKNKIKEGRTGDRYVKVVDVSIPTKIDPAKDDKFVLKRDMLTKKLVLQMKQKVVEGLGAVFSAEERNEIFHTNDLTTVRANIAVPTKPVFGVTMLAQAESWDGENYHMAGAAVWSKVLEKAAIAMLDGKKIEAKGGDKMVSEWLESIDLGLVCGPRQLVDPKGNRVFLGISARETGLNAMRDRANQRAAQVSALSYLTMSLFSDIDMVTQQEAAMNVFETSATSADVDVWEEINDKIGQNVQKRMLEGANEIYSTTVEHPISGKKMYVSVYSLDADSIAAARVRIEEMIAARVIAENANKRALGRHQGYQDKVDAAKRDMTHFNQGRAEGKAAVDAKLKTPASKKAEVTPAAKKPAANSQQGVFSGEDTISNDF